MSLSTFARIHPPAFMLKFSKYETTISIAALLLLTVVIEYMLFGKIVFHPNDYCFMLNPDGTQIYFNYAWHVKYGSGTLLTNQNYPFYELIFMTDAQAALSTLMNYINHHWFNIEPYSIGIFNSILLISIPFCSLFLYKIFKYLGLHSFISILFAIFICFLSPQLVRITAGHYGLGYVFYFPALIYMLFKLTDSRSHAFLYFTGIALLLIFFGLNNGHMSLAGCLQVFAFGTLWLLTQWKQKGLRKYLPLLASLLSFAVLFGIIHGLDFVMDREALPWGFLVFYSQFESIFLPTSGIVHDFINRLTPIITVNSEGEAYVGIIGFFILAYSTWRLLTFVWKKKFSRLLFPFRNQQVNVLLLASLPILFYAMAYPFRWGMESLLDTIPFLKQFRAPGRFSWIFFYAFSIYMAYAINLLYRWLHQRKKVLAYVMLLAISVLYTLDIYSLHTFNFRYLEGRNYPVNPFVKNKEKQDFLNTLQIDSTHYQAIFGIPLCNAWNSKFGRDLDPGDLVKQMADVSLRTGIPWMNAKLSRISTSQVVLSAQLLSNKLIVKELLNIIPKDKHILLMYQKDYHLQESESFLIEHASRIGEDERFVYYNFNPSTYLYAYRDSLRRNFDVLMQQQEETKNQLRKTGLLIEQYNASAASGVFTDPKNDKVIFKGSFPGAGINQLMEFSIWNKLDAATDGSPWVEMLVTDAKGNPIEDKWFWLAHAEDYQHGYLRLSIPFEVKDTSHRFIFKLKPGKGHRFERMMIRPAGVDVFDTMNNKRYVNAYMLD